MFDIPLHSVLKIVTDSFDTAGAKPPKVLTDTAKHVATIRDRFARASATNDNLADAVLTALADDRDPTTDPAVQRIVTRQAINGGGIQGRVLQALEREVRPTLAANFDTLVAAWRKPFDTAAKTLTAVHAELGDVDLDSANDVLRSGPNAAQTWGDAQRAIATITAIRNAWVNLAHYTNAVAIHRDMALMQIADVPGDTWLKRKLRGAQSDPWFAVTNGLTLALPTPSDYRARLADVEAARERQQAAAMVKMRGEARFGGVGAGR